MTSRRSLAQAYLFLQATAVALWWLWLFSSSAARERFTIAGWPEQSLLAFAAPDLVLLVFGSAIAGLAVGRGHTWAPLAMWLVAGAAGYATVFCLAASLMSNSIWLGTTMMLFCLAGSITVAWCNRQVAAA